MTRPGEIPPSSSLKESRPKNPPAFEQLTTTEQEVYLALFHTYRELAIDPADFSDYDQDKIEDDLNYVARMEAKFANEDDPRSAFNQRQGELAETLIWNGIENNGWLGPDAGIIVPSRYDDIQNDVDEIVEFDRTDGFDYLSLSIDVTSSTKGAIKKLIDIRNKLKRGELSEIKYFKSEAASFTGRKDNVPHVVIGFDHHTIQEVSLLEAKIIRLNKAIQSGEDNQYNIDQRANARTKLGNHWVQVLILKEVKIQLETFEMYARKNGHDATADHIRKDLGIVDTQLKERISELAPTPQLLEELTEHLQNDKLYQTLVSNLKDFDRI